MKVDYFYDHRDKVVYMCNVKHIVPPGFAGAHFVLKKYIVICSIIIWKNSLSFIPICPPLFSRFCIFICSIFFLFAFSTLFNGSTRLKRFLFESAFFHSSNAVQQCCLYWRIFSLTMFGRYLDLESNFCKLSFFFAKYHQTRKIVFHL